MPQMKLDILIYQQFEKNKYSSVELIHESTTFVKLVSPVS